ncbi:hypothetical protein ACFPK9_10575 [Rubritalea spongiae]|uniref:Uncharacterized protein n=1 Tax=Rubritalea spongiae TaxID=430797 RepID=A0ABW5DXQ8_9BACT
MDEELRAIEKQLEQLSPAEMPDDILARMEQAMDSWQEHVPAEEKIVQFEPVSREKGGMKLFNIWASAAAVALIAATSFVILKGEDAAPAQTELAEAVVAPEPLAEVIPPNSVSAVIPASNTQFETQVKAASDDVITYDAMGRPMRIMQVEFEDEVTVKGRDGKVYKVKQPRREYYAVPVEIH